jgi:acyl carrier protein
MNSEEVFIKVQAIFRDIFDNQMMILKLDMNSSHIEDWDSLAQINLIVAIEKDFKLKFSLIEMNGLENVGDMLRLIEAKINAIR